MGEPRSASPSPRHLLRPWVALVPAVALVVAFFLPLVVVSGPFSSDIRVSACDAVRNLGGGDDRGANDHPDNAVVARAKSELRGLRIPLGGPLLLALSAAALVAQYALLPVIGVQLARCRLGPRLHIAWMAMGVAFVALFLAGAAVTQHGLNEIHGSSLTQQVAALFSKAAARLYDIRIGPGGIVVAAASIAGLLIVASPLARRMEPAA